MVASELIAHGYNLFYYDNRSKGEVDYLIDDYESLSTVPIEVKSGKDYTIHSALNTFVSNEDYHIQKAFVLSNERIVTTTGKITYLPIYYVMFFENKTVDGEIVITTTPANAAGRSLPHSSIWCLLETLKNSLLFQK